MSYSSLAAFGGMVDSGWYFVFRKLPVFGWQEIGWYWGRQNVCAVSRNVFFDYELAIWGHTEQTWVLRGPGANCQEDRVSYSGFGISFEASASTSGGASASSSGGGGGSTGPKTALPLGPSCGPGYKPNPMFAFTPTALLPKSTLLSPLCLVDKSAPAPAPQQAIFMVKPPVQTATFLKSGSPVSTPVRTSMVLPSVEDSGVPMWAWILGGVAIAGGGFYLYKRSKKPS